MTVTTGARLVAHGLRAQLPVPWEGRIYRRDAPLGEAVDVDRDTHADVGPFATLRTAAHPAAVGWAGESTNPVMHLANFALRPGRGDFGTGAVEHMREAHVFVSLLEYDRVEANTALFAAQGIPRPTVRDFAPNALQRRLTGQLGCQRFFTESGRAFCLYVVLGSRRHADALVASLHEVLDGLDVSSGDGIDGIDL